VWQRSATRPFTCWATTTWACQARTGTSGRTVFSTRRHRKLVAIVRAERPQVVVTYADGRARYAHPDHLRVHDVVFPPARRRTRGVAMPPAARVQPEQPLHAGACSRRNRVVARLCQLISLRAKHRSADLRQTLRSTTLDGRKRRNQAHAFEPRQCAVDRPGPRSDAGELVDIFEDGIAVLRPVGEADQD
jgi:LmbE family N-acetylglucosaminyl deacetylase